MTTTATIHAEKTQVEDLQTEERRPRVLLTRLKRSLEYVAGQQNVEIRAACLARLASCDRSRVVLECTRRNYRGITLKRSMSAPSLAQGSSSRHDSQLRQPGLATTTATIHAEGGGYEAKKSYRELTREIKMPRGRADRFIIRDRTRSKSLRRTQVNPRILPTDVQTSKTGLLRDPN